MSNLELKGGILQMIASVNDPDTLTGLNMLISDYIRQHIKGTEYWDELDESEKTELEAAILESENENNHVSHEIVMEKYQQWLHK